MTSMCRVCLAGNIRLLKLSKIHLEVYEKLTNTEINSDTESGMPSTVCYICHRQLQRCHTFLEMACVSNRILRDVLHNGTEVTHNSVAMQSLQIIPALTMSPTQHTSVDNDGYSNAPSSPVTVKEEQIINEDGETTATTKHFDIDIEECKLETLDIKLEPLDDSVKTEQILECKDDSRKSRSESDVKPNTHSWLYCDVCNKQFCRKSDLVKHIFKFHNGAHPYSCIKCEKIFSSKSALRKHIRIHSGEKPYSCNRCCKTFVVQDRLTRHLRIHTGEKPYSCKGCNKTYTYKTNLARHMRVHTGEKPYACTECHKIFTENGSLTKHMRVHTGEKPYSCNKCDQTFTQKCNVKRHMRIHTGEKPYSCSECNKIFTDKGNLKRHMRIHT